MSLVALPAFHDAKIFSYVSAAAVTAIKPIARTDSFGATRILGSDVFISEGAPIMTTLKPDDVARLLRGSIPITLADSA